MSQGTTEPLMGQAPTGCPGTLIAAFDATAVAGPTAPALRAFGTEHVVSWHDYAVRSRRLAGTFAGLGLQRGDVVAMLLTNRPEFHLADAAALRLGCVALSLYATAAPEQMAFQLDHSRARLVVTERRFVSVIQPLAVARGIGLVVVDDPQFPYTAERFADVDIRPDDVACLVYTSGTTGVPKAVEISHRRIIAMITGVFELMPPPAVRRVLSYLPAAHIAERAFSHYVPMLYGSFVTSVDHPELFPRALAEVEPTMVFGVPRVWEKLKTSMQAAPDAAPAGFGLGKVQWAAVGGAACRPDVIEFFVSIGVPLAEVWGMSETSGISTVNPPSRGPGDSAGSVGLPIPGVEITLAPDGEMLVRGATACPGYRDDPLRTAETFMPGGWIRTGDIGSIDANGLVRITGRKKDLIITSSGKNLSPTAIESAVKAETPLVAHVCAVGDGRPYIVALVCVDAKQTAGMTPEEIHAAVTAAIDWANVRLARIEQVKRFSLVPDSWPPGGQYVTATEKLRRDNIARDYAATIEVLFRASDPRQAEG
jgi:long-subunit acyl-CoA synthetase (AMP-forming)